MIEHITCEGGDYEVLKVNGEVWYEGNSIPSSEWLMLLRTKYACVTSLEITDEQMEQGDY